MKSRDIVKVWVPSQVSKNKPSKTGPPLQQLQHHGAEAARVQRGEADVRPVRLRLVHDPHAHLAGVAGLLLRAEVPLHPRQGPAGAEADQPGQAGPRHHIH